MTSLPALSDNTTQTIRAAANEHLPLLFAAGMALIALANLIVGTPLNSDILLLITSALLAIQTLHKNHLHEQQISTYTAHYGLRPPSQSQSG